MEKINENYINGYNDAIKKMESLMEIKKKKNREKTKKVIDEIHNDINFIMNEEFDDLAVEEVCLAFTYKLLIEMKKEINHLMKSNVNQHIELQDFENLYLNIIKSKNLRGLKRTKALSKIMTQMENHYSIPFLRNEAWEKNNYKVIELYRKIANARNL